MKKVIRITESELISLVKGIIEEQSTAAVAKKPVTTNKDLSRGTQEIRQLIEKIKPNLVGKNVAVNFRPSNSEKEETRTVRITGIEVVEADYNKLINPIANPDLPDIALPYQLRLVTDDLSFRDQYGTKSRDPKKFEVQKIYFGCKQPNQVSVFDPVIKYRFGVSKQIQDYLSNKLGCKGPIRRDVNFGN